MAFAYDRLTEITTIAASAAAVYTNAASTTTYIRLIIIHNGNTTAEAVKLYNVPNNGAAVGTAATANEMFAPTGGLAAGEDYYLEFPVPGIILEDTNDTIQGTTTTAAKVTIQIYGGTE